MASSSLRARLEHEVPKSELVRISLLTEQITATGNHPFYVTRGRDLCSRPIPPDIGDDPVGCPLPSSSYFAILCGSAPLR